MHRFFGVAGIIPIDCLLYFQCWPQRPLGWISTFPSEIHSDPYVHLTLPWPLGPLEILPWVWRYLVLGRFPTHYPMKGCCPPSVGRGCHTSRVVALWGTSRWICHTHVMCAQEQALLYHLQMPLSTERLSPPGLDLEVTHHDLHQLPPEPFGAAAALLSRPGVDVDVVTWKPWLEVSMAMGVPQ